ncbi:uncharacterized protein LOC119299428 [Triticum dicoccoides]|uniref:uncharacterized protein LOC119299428 n=1 Tax=Triticum dicoccoides TaxID=85692 RepID=UPI00189005BB|nr:uncharacterized protein LOC119299428 [Triticum dicoccoides]
MAAACSSPRCRIEQELALKYPKASDQELLPWSSRTNLAEASTSSLIASPTASPMASSSVETSLPVLLHLASSGARAYRRSATARALSFLPASELPCAAGSETPSPGPARSRRSRRRQPPSPEFLVVSCADLQVPRRRCSASASASCQEEGVPPLWKDCGPSRSQPKRPRDDGDEGVGADSGGDADVVPKSPKVAGKYGISIRHNQPRHPMKLVNIIYENLCHFLSIEGMLERDEVTIFRELVENNQDTVIMRKEEDQI